MYVFRRCGLSVDAREQQPAILGREDAEQLRDCRTARFAVRLFTAFDDDKELTCAAGFGGPFSGRITVHERRASQPVGEDIPRRLGLPVDGVEIEIHKAIRKRAGGEVLRVRAHDICEGVRREGGLPQPGRPDDGGVLTGPQPLGELLPLTFAAEELVGGRRQLARNARRLCARHGTRFELDHDLLRSGGKFAGRRGRDNRARGENVLAQQVSRGVADLGSFLAGLGDGKVVFVEAHGVRTHAGMGRGCVDD